MHFKKYTVIIWITLLVVGHSYASEVNIEGFYLGGGSGLNITSNSNLCELGIRI